MSESAKLILFNALSDSIQWSSEEPSVSKPPTIILAGVSSIVPYTNIIGNPANIALVRDGSQNIPIVFGASGDGLTVDWGVVNVEPKAIAIINHNCWESGDHIEIRYLVGESLAFDIASPNRSADLFYPLRMNDAWINDSALQARFWTIRFFKTSGLPFVGEIFFAFEFTSFLEFDPQPDVGIGVSYLRNASRNNTIAGAPVIYDTQPPSLRWGLNWSRKKEDDNVAADTDFLLDWPMLLTSQATQPNRKSVFIWKNDRVCQMGKLSFPGSEAISPDRSVQPALSFVGKFPRKSLREVPHFIPS